MFDKLVQTLIAAVAVSSEYFHSQGIVDVPHRPLEVHWMDQVDDTHAEGRSDMRDEPDVEGLLMSHREQLQKLPAVMDLRETLVRFAQQQGGLPKSSWPSAEADAALRALHICLSQAAGFAMDRSIAEETISVYCDAIQSPTITVRSVFCVRGLTAPSAFHLSDEIAFRPISHDDFVERAQTARVPWPHGQPWLNNKDWICQVNKKGPRDTFEAANWDNDGARHIAATLGLAACGRASLTLLRSHQANPFLHSWNKSSSQPVPVGGSGGTLSLVQADIELARELFPRIELAMSSKGHRYIGLAVERFAGAAQKREAGDRLVDYVVGLESLLAPDTERLEATFRFRLRGAAILPSSFGEPRERITLMGRLYDMRSSVVHGDTNEAELADYVPKAEDVLRHTIRWYLGGDRWGQKPKDVVRGLDEALVRGGFQWAHA